MSWDINGKFKLSGSVDFPGHSFESGKLSLRPAKDNSGNEYRFTQRSSLQTQNGVEFYPKDIDWENLIFKENAMVIKVKKPRCVIMMKRNCFSKNIDYYAKCIQLLRQGQTDFMKDIENEDKCKNGDSSVSLDSMPGYNSNDSPSSNSSKRKRVRSSSPNSNRFVTPNKKSGMGKENLSEFAQINLKNETEGAFTESSLNGRNLKQGLSSVNNEDEDCNLDFSPNFAVCTTNKLKTKMLRRQRKSSKIPEDFQYKSEPYVKKEKPPFGLTGFDLTSKDAEHIPNLVEKDGHFFLKDEGYEGDGTETTSYKIPKKEKQLEPPVYRTPYQNGNGNSSKFLAKSKDKSNAVLADITLCGYDDDIIIPSSQKSSAKKFYGNSTSHANLSMSRKPGYLPDPSKPQNTPLYSTYTATKNTYSTTQSKISTSAFSTSTPFNPFKFNSSTGESTKKELRGFQNLGNTCYMNSILQSLIGTISFPRDIQLALHRKDCRKLIPNESLYNCLHELIKVREKRTTQKEQSYRLENVKNVISKDARHFSGNMQHDAYEFLIQVMNQLKEEVIKYNKLTPLRLMNQPHKVTDKADELANPTIDNFEFALQVTIKCSQCGQERTKTETMNGLILDFKGQSIQDCLKCYFKEQEINGYQCENCTGGKSTRTQKIAKMPRVLILHIKRYSFNRDNSQIEKLKTKIIIPKFVTLMDHTCGEDTQPPPYPQELPKGMLLSANHSIDDSVKSKTNASKRLFGDPIEIDDDDDDAFQKTLENSKKDVTAKDEETQMRMAMQQSMLDITSNPLSKEDQELQEVLKLSKQQAAGQSSKQGQNGCISGSNVGKQQPISEEDRELQKVLELSAQGEGGQSLNQGQNYGLQKEELGQGQSNIGSGLNDEVWSITEDDNDKLEAPKLGQNHSQESGQGHTHTSSDPINEEMEIEKVKQLSKSEEKKRKREIEEEEESIKKVLKLSEKEAQKRNTPVKDSGIESLEDIFTSSDHENDSDSDILSHMTEEEQLKQAINRSITDNGSAEKHSNDLQSSDIFKKSVNLIKDGAAKKGTDKKKSKNKDIGTDSVPNGIVPPVQNGKCNASLKPTVLATAKRFSEESVENKENKTPETGTPNDTEPDWITKHREKVNSEVEANSDDDPVLKTVLKESHEAAHISNSVDEDNIRLAKERSLRDQDKYKRMNGGFEEWGDDLSLDIINSLDSVEEETQQLKENYQTGEMAFSYRLISIVNHLGSTSSSGHYISDVYSIERKQWESFDDGHVSQMSEKEIHLRKQASGYIFFYMNKEIFNELQMEYEKIN